MDESTFNAAGKQMYTWQPQGYRIIAPENRPYIPSVTVYGAVSTELSVPVFMFGPATN